MIRMALPTAFVLGALTAVPEARAQFVDPLSCLPPAGQGMWEIAASNLARRYRTEPTAENKTAMCNRFRSTIKVYEDADGACRQSTCKEVAFKRSCANVREKVTVWRKRTSEECS